VDPFYQELLGQAANSDLDTFCRRVTSPALVLQLPEDSADFVTKVGITTADLSGDPEQDPLAPTAVRLVQKSDRNPYVDRISVGRAQSCDIVLRHPSVSKLHAHFLQLEGGYWGVRDANSRNGVRVNGERVSSKEPTKLAPDDWIRIGGLETRFVYPAALWKILRGQRSASSRPPPSR
jgi:hypothetical protein